MYPFFLETKKIIIVEKINFLEINKKYIISK